MALGDDYITAADLRSFLRIEDTDDDDEMGLVVTAVSSWVTAYCRRDFNQATDVTARTYYAKGQCLEVDDISTATGLIVKSDLGDDGTYETTWASTDYQLEPLNGVYNGLTGWPYTRIRFVETTHIVPTRATSYRPAFEVTAKWGWAAVPESVKRAALIQSARVLKRRDSAEGILGNPEFGVVRVGTLLDPDVQDLLDPYRPELGFA